jgi:hypothetical protein
MRVIWVLLLSVLSCSAMSPLESRLDRQMRLWQKRLGMDDWNVAVRVVRQSEINPNAWGEAQWDPDNRTATISVLDPRDYNLRGSELRQDMECTIVHELVHIQVAPLDARDEGVREEVVNRIMTALLNRQCPN